MEKNIIYNEKNTITMQRLESNCIDLIVTSPPYNIIRPNSTDRGYDLYKDGMSNDEYIDWTLDIFKGFDKVLKPNGVVLYNMSYGTENTILMSLVVADIIRKSEFKQMLHLCLPILYFWNGKRIYKSPQSLFR